MVNPSVFDKLADRIAAAIPDDAKMLREDLNRTVRLAVSNGLSRLELVTREEFDVQTELLERTRARLEALEARVQALENPPAVAQEVGAPGEEGEQTP
ncbi:MAG: accessory factor UbiK family protein [Gammaproteobacteria bacterium]|nr:accessory factor UbiK family protein [Gammaproteobacteria bacterium]